MQLRAKNFSFEALAEVTGTDWDAGRGELNKALQLIRGQMAGIDDDLLADEIRLRARVYRNFMPNMMLTPTALAKHWLRLVTQPAKKAAATCATCDNLHLILISDEGHGTYAPCPDCGPKDVT